MRRNDLLVAFSWVCVASLVFARLAWLARLARLAQRWRIVPLAAVPPAVRWLFLSAAARPQCCENAAVAP